MAAYNARDMDGFMALLTSTDTKAKLTIANNLINYLAEPDNSIECSDIGQVIDSLIPWMQSSNNKVSQNGIDAMTYLVDRMGVDFRPYISTVLPPIIDRLGDSKEMVREKSQLFILKLMEKDVITPQTLFEKLLPAFSHKNGKIREEVMNCLQTTLTEHGAQSLSISRLLPSIVKLLGDPMASVRDTAFNSLVEIYRHVGERLRVDLQKKYAVPASKLPALMARFDEMKAAGDMLPSAMVDGPLGRNEDDTDGAVMSSATKMRANSVPRKTPASTTKSAPSSAAASGSKIRRTSSLRRGASSAGGQAGAMDEETFTRSFEDVPTVQLFSSRDLDDSLNQIREIISDPNKDWNKRVDALKKLRSLLIAGAANFEELFAHIRLLEIPFQAVIKDLRSQVVREACLTIAFLSEKLRHKLDKFAEAVLPNLINLIQNSAKVMASAGLVTVRFLIRYTHSHRMIPIITQNLSSKSKDIRRAVCEFLEQLLSSWSTHSLERHCALLQEAIKKGIADADLEARLSARKAYWSFRSHFPDQAEALLNSLDVSYKRALNGDLAMSNSSSSNSLHQQGRHGTTPRPRFTGSATGCMQSSCKSGPPRSVGRPLKMKSSGTHLSTPKPLRVNPSGSKSTQKKTVTYLCSSISKKRLSRCRVSIETNSSARKKNDFKVPTPRNRIGLTPDMSHGFECSSNASPSFKQPGPTARRKLNIQYGVASARRGPATPGSSLRSNSAIDLQAAQRAKARAQYAALARQKVGSGASLPRPRKVDTVGAMTMSAITSPERAGRARSRVSGVSQSQPSSRSGSPSSRLSYATYASREPAAEAASPATAGRPRRLSGIPRSTGASRETSREPSPSRFGGLHDRSFGSKLRSRPVHGITTPDRPPPAARPVMAQKILQQSLEAESALADALNFDTMDSGDFSRLSNSGRKGFRPFDDHSDDSETSSVCSERSFDSFRRPSDSFSWSGSQQRLYRDLLEPSNKDISDIIANCASTHWSDRKEGLVGLQSYFQNGNMLTGTELKKVTEIFTKMFNDSHTKVFSLFLDTLNELILTHKADLNDWLYCLLTRLLNKLGGDLLGSIQTKIHRSLAVVRESFPHELLLGCILRFIVDQTQTPNTKVKVAMLTFLTQLAGACVESPCSLGSHSNAPPALARIIAWMSDAKSADIRRAAQMAVIALFNVDTPQVTMMLSSLPSEYQEAAASLVQNHLRRSSTTSPPSLSPGLQSPGTPQQPRTPRTPALDMDDSLNPEEVYRSLRRTTAEIQNYSFESGLGSGKQLERDRDTTSQDSGISQMSLGAGLEEQLEAMSLGSNGWSNGNGSPTHRLNAINAINKDKDAANGLIPSESHQHEEAEAVRKVVDTLTHHGAPDSPAESTEAERKAALAQLLKLIREGSTVTVIEQFKTVLRVLLDQLAKPESSIRVLVFNILTEMLKKRCMASCFQNFVELLVLKVFEAHRDASKEVLRVAESCAATMGTVLPPDIVIRVLIPLITTGDYPVNQGAIKMMTKVVESHPREVIEPHVASVMPGLITAYDDEESSVRKSAVFCMVALHNLVGEDGLQPHLAALNGSKLKLLHLYIKRAQQGSSAPTSPKNAPP
ncbi:CLIP-associating protein 1-B isoform X2 [Bacillus rossius redtenbacheri]|uniref:CLIP-associating protein 1-B isoform X2 n=1 Tax=Bacillus rossius redtenbacheri TaxID=93214 RepID=UPI002FDCD17E